MLTYYSKGQKAEFVMTEQSAVRVESSGVSGNIFIKPLIGKERIISLNFAPFYTQLDDFDAGTIVFLSVDSGFGRVGIEVSGNNTVQIVNNQSLLSFKFGNRLNPPVVPAGEDGVLFVDQNGILCTVDKLGNVFEIGASRLAPSALAALNNIVPFEMPFELLTAEQRTASAAGGGFVGFVVSRNQGANLTNTPSYEIWSSADEFGTYTLDDANTLYAPSGLLQGQITRNHTALSVVDEIDAPVSVSPNTAGLIVDSTGQKEFVLLQGIKTITIGGESARVFDNVGVAIYYSVPINVPTEENARLYVLTAYAQDPSLRTGTRFYKVTPKDSLGNIKPLLDIKAIPFTVRSMAMRPNPPRGLRFGFLSNPANIEFPSIQLGGEQLYINLSPSSKIDETTPSSYFNPQALNETGVAYKVDVEGLGGSGTPVRTLTADGAFAIFYTQATRAADGSRVSTIYKAYAEKAGIKSDSIDVEINQRPALGNKTLSITATQAGLVVTAAVVTEYGSNASFGFGNERSIYFIELKGTALPFVNFDGITFPAGIEKLFSVSDGSQLYIQAPKSQLNFSFTIPITGGAATVLEIRIGNDSVHRSITTITLV